MHLKTAGAADSKSLRKGNSGAIKMIFFFLAYCRQASIIGPGESPDPCSRSSAGSAVPLSGTESMYRYCVPSQTTVFVWTSVAEEIGMTPKRTVKRKTEKLAQELTGRFLAGMEHG